MLQEAIQRTQRQAIGGYCGLTGVCGVAVGIGAAFSVLLSAACPKDKETRLTMEVVSRIVQSIAELTGPCLPKPLCVARSHSLRKIGGISFSPTKDNLHHVRFIPTVAGKKMSFAMACPTGCG